MGILLQTQIVLDSTEIVKEKTLSIMELISSGGIGGNIIMSVLGVLSIFAIYILIERISTLNKAKKETPNFVAQINNLVKEGLNKKQAIIDGATDRFRPILMTATTTIFGLLPTAMAIGKGAGANVPLSIAVIGGTATATIITLYIIPIFYLMIAKTEKS